MMPLACDAPPKARSEALFFSKLQTSTRSPKPGDVDASFDLATFCGACFLEYGGMSSERQRNARSS